jgi:hypothetical protein
MPRLACWSCGRQIYTPSAVDSLFSEERRCPRCGAFLNVERREGERRVHNRRQNPPSEPGPPTAGEERRVDDRRKVKRRGAQGPTEDDDWMVDPDDA